MRKLILARLAAVAVTALVAAACGGGTDSPEEASPTPAETSPADTTAAEGGDSETTLPPGATPGLDDYDQDGQPEPTCGTREFGAGLVLRIPCDDLSGYANEPAEGLTLVPDSLYSLPGIPDELNDVLSGISGTAVRARDAEGKQVYVFFLYSDTVFELGSDSLAEPAKESLDNLAASLQRRWPTAHHQVRGHTDSTGSPSTNQALSERRAANVSAYLGMRGIDPARLSSVGLGQALPLYVDKNPDGSDNPTARSQNRRVEIVVRVP